LSYPCEGLDKNGLGRACQRSGVSFYLQQTAEYSHKLNLQINVQICRNLIRLQFISGANPEYAVVTGGNIRFGGNVTTPYH
jgi:hypothetical protein